MILIEYKILKNKILMDQLESKEAKLFFIAYLLYKSQKITV